MTVRELESRIDVDEVAEWAAVLSLEADEQEQARKEAEQKAKAQATRRR